MKTYQERVGRFRILRHTEYPEDMKAEMLLKGIDPDDNWALIWSFDDRAAAEAQLEEELEVWNRPCYTTKIVDAGAATTIERPVY